MSAHDNQIHYADMPAHGHAAFTVPATTQPTERKNSSSPSDSPKQTNHLYEDEFGKSEITANSVFPGTKQNKLNPDYGDDKSAYMDASQGASQFMKSMMNSYNAGNVNFYDNLHRKYFDKAKE